MQAKTWINLKGILLKKKTKVKKATYCMIPFIFCKGKAVNMVNSIEFVMRERSEKGKGLNR